MLPIALVESPVNGDKFAHVLIDKRFYKITLVLRPLHTLYNALTGIRRYVEHIQYTMYIAEKIMSWLETKDFII